jgi:hypothetical protein
MALRDSLGLTPRRIVSVLSSSGRARAAQPDDQGFFPWCQAGVEAVRPGRAVDDVGTGFPARHGAAADAELVSQRGVAGLALLDLSVRARRAGGVGMQSQQHQPALPCRGLRRTL